LRSRPFRLEPAKLSHTNKSPPPPPEIYGTGFYGTIDAGANAFQGCGGSTTFTERPDRITTDIVKISLESDVGFFGGIKPGYVFGTGLVRPAIEGDLFYNGFSRDADFKLIEIIDPCAGNPLCLAPIFFTSRKGGVSTWINTGAFMGTSSSGSRSEDSSCMRAQG
jgi:hypothetical protein